MSLLLALVAVAGASRSGGGGSGNDFGGLRVGDDRGCKGMLKYPCVCDQVSVECVNGQFTTDEIFLNVGIHFNYLERVAFHGNNFNRLGGSTGHLFGAGVRHSRLRNLNLSANYIVEIHPDAFLGMPVLEALDLSNNELVLRDPVSLPLLRPLPRLRRLYMKKAFSRPADWDSNATSLQLEVLESVFESASLRHLEVLDLSWNFLRFVPYNLGCSLPSLTHLVLKNNFLDTLSLNTSCLQRIQVLDLSGNMFRSLGHSFRLTAHALPPFALLLQHNDWACDCSGPSWLPWLRSSRAVRDRDALACRLASPPRFKKALLMTVPLEELDCETTLSGAAAALARLLPTLIAAFAARLAR